MTGKVFGLYVVLVDWHDGDTFHGVLDQGIGTFRGASIALVAGRAVIEPIPYRCWAIDAAELSTGVPGREATAGARALAPPGTYKVDTYKPDHFGRPLVDLVLPDGRLFSVAMIAAGLAVPFLP